tara:strand:+ start:10952 stop:15394 length:4443 start_codon:yes stop_codon:yes gene_type:complete
MTTEDEFNRLFSDGYVNQKLHDEIVSAYEEHREIWLRHGIDIEAFKLWYTPTSLERHHTEDEVISPDNPFTELQDVIMRPMAMLASRRQTRLIDDIIREIVKEIQNRAYLYEMSDAYGVTTKYAVYYENVRIMPNKTRPEDAVKNLESYYVRIMGTVMLGQVTYEDSDVTIQRMSITEGAVSIIPFRSNDIRVPMTIHVLPIPVDSRYAFTTFMPYPEDVPFGAMLINSDPDRSNNDPNTAIGLGFRTTRSRQMISPQESIQYKVKQTVYTYVTKRAYSSISIDSSNVGKSTTKPIVPIVNTGSGSKKPRISKLPWESYEPSMYVRVLTRILDGKIPDTPLRVNIFLFIYYMQQRIGIQSPDPKTALTSINEDIKEQVLAFGGINKEIYDSNITNIFAEANTQFRSANTFPSFLEQTYGNKEYMSETVFGYIADYYTLGNRMNDIELYYLMMERIYDSMFESPTLNNNDQRYEIKYHMIVAMIVTHIRYEWEDPTLVVSPDSSWERRNVLSNIHQFLLHMRLEAARLSNESTNTFYSTMDQHFDSDSMYHKVYEHHRKNGEFYMQTFQTSKLWTKVFGNANQEDSIMYISSSGDSFIQEKIIVPASTKTSITSSKRATDETGMEYLSTARDDSETSGLRYRFKLATDISVQESDESTRRIYGAIEYYILYVQNHEFDEKRPDILDERRGIIHENGVASLNYILYDIIQECRDLYYRRAHGMLEGDQLSVDQMYVIESPIRRETVSVWVNGIPRVTNKTKGDESMLLTDSAVFEYYMRRMKKNKQISYMTGIYPISSNQVDISVASGRLVQPMLVTKKIVVDGLIVGTAVPKIVDRLESVVQRFKYSSQLERDMYMIRRFIPENCEDWEYIDAREAKLKKHATNWDLAISREKGEGTTQYTDYEYVILGEQQVIPGPLNRLNGENYNGVSRRRYENERTSSLVKCDKNTYQLGLSRDVFVGDLGNRRAQRCIYNSLIFNTLHHGGPGRETHRYIRTSYANRDETQEDAILMDDTAPLLYKREFTMSHSYVSRDGNDSYKVNYNSPTSYGELKNKKGRTFQQKMAPIIEWVNENPYLDYRIGKHSSSSTMTSEIGNYIVIVPKVGQIVTDDTILIPIFRKTDSVIGASSIKGNFKMQGSIITKVDVYTTFDISSTIVKTIVVHFEQMIGADSLEGVKITDFSGNKSVITPMSELDGRHLATEDGIQIMAIRDATGANRRVLNSSPYSIILVDIYAALLVRGQILPRQHIRSVDDPLIKKILKLIKVNHWEDVYLVDSEPRKTNLTSSGDIPNMDVPRVLIGKGVLSGWSLTSVININPINNMSVGGYQPEGRRDYMTGLIKSNNLGDKQMIFSVQHIQSVARTGNSNYFGEVVSDENLGNYTVYICVPCQKKAEYKIQETVADDNEDMRRTKEAVIYCTECNESATFQVYPTKVIYSPKADFARIMLKKSMSPMLHLLESVNVGMRAKVKPKRNKPETQEWI